MLVGDDGEVPTGADTTIIAITLYKGNANDQA
jgi:hypothetical protein